MFHQFENTKWLVARNPCRGGRSCSLAQKSKTVFTTFRGVSQQDKVKNIYGWQNDRHCWFLIRESPAFPPIEITIPVQTSHATGDGARKCSLRSKRDQIGERQILKKIYRGCRARSLARHELPCAFWFSSFWFWLFLARSISGFYLWHFWFLPLSTFWFLVFTVGKKWGTKNSNRRDS